MTIFRDSRKQVLWLLAIVNFLHIVDFMILMPLGEVLMRSFSISPGQFSWLVSSYTLAAGFSGFMGAFWLDRLDKRTVLLVTFAGFAVGTFFCALAVSYEFLLIARFVTGFFGGVTTALLIAMASDLFPYQERGYAMGMLSASFSVASVAGVPFGLFLANSWNWRLPFYVVACLSLLILWILYKKLPAFQPGEAGINRKNLTILASLFRDKNQFVSLTLGFLIVFGHFLIIPFITPYLVRNVLFPESAIPWVYMVGGGFTIFSAPYIGRLTDRLGAGRVFKGLLLLSLVPVFLLSHLGVTSVIWVLMVTTLFFILGSGRMIPAQTMITGAVAPEHRGSFMSFRSSIQQMATSLAAIAAGLWVHQRPDGTLEGFNLLGLFSIAVLLLALIPASRIRLVG